MLAPPSHPRPEKEYIRPEPGGAGRDIPGSILGVGVGCEDLKIFEGLIFQRSQQMRQVFLFIEGGNDDTEHDKAHSMEISLVIVKVKQPPYLFKVGTKGNSWLETAVLCLSASHGRNNFSPRPENSLAVVDLRGKSHLGSLQPEESCLTF